MAVIRPWFSIMMVVMMVVVVMVVMLFLSLFPFDFFILNKSPTWIIRTAFHALWRFCVANWDVGISTGQKTYVISPISTTAVVVVASCQAFCCIRDGTLLRPRPTFFSPALIMTKQWC